MLRHLLAGRAGSTMSGKGPPRSGRPFHVMCSRSIAGAGMHDLAHVPQQRHAARGLQTFLGRAVLGVRRLGPAVHAGHGDRPALLILHGTHAAADGAVLQFNIKNRVHVHPPMGQVGLSIAHIEEKGKKNIPLPCHAKTPRRRKAPGRFAPVTEWRWRCSWAAASSHSWARRWSGCHPQTWR